jgi:hypothetical protein
MANKYLSNYFLFLFSPFGETPPQEKEGWKKGLGRGSNSIP